MDEQVNKMCFIHTVKYYSTVKMNGLNEVLIQATTGILLNAKSFAQKGTYYVIPFKQSVQSRQIYADRKCISDWLPGAWGKGRMDSNC